ncbi:FAD-dependent oxidoreductase [Streptomyces sp. NPDC001617]
MTPPPSVLIVGESLAGTTTARELRALGHRGRATIIGAEEHGAYSRPPLSKAVLRDPAADDTLSHHLDGLDVDIVRSAAVGVDTDRRVVTTADGRQFDYGAPGRRHSCRLPQARRTRPARRTPTAHP